MDVPTRIVDVPVPPDFATRREVVRTQQLVQISGGIVKHKADVPIPPVVVDVSVPKSSEETVHGRSHSTSCRYPSSAEVSCLHDVRVMLLERSPIRALILAVSCRT